MPHKDPEVRKAYKKVYNKAHKKQYYEANRAALSVYWKEYYQKNKERLKKKQRAQYNKDVVRHLVYAAKDRAIKLGLEFNIDPHDVEMPAVCPVFGTPFVVGNRDTAASLDRVDSSKGYVKGNVAIISFRANRLKNNATLEDLEKIIRYMEWQEEQSALLAAKVS